MALFGAAVAAAAAKSKSSSGGGGGRKRKFGASALGRDDDDSDGEGNFHPHGFQKWGPARQKMWSVLTNEKTDWLLATMILSSVVILILDADLTAKMEDRGEEGLTSQETVAASVAAAVSTAYTCIYAIEMTLRVYVFRAEVFRSGMLFDFMIVAADILLLIADLTLGTKAQLSFLRMFRLARLFRFVRVVGMFPELQFLVKGFISSFSAVFWGSILMWIVILMWAIIAVYWIHPVNRAIVKDKDADSEMCGRDCRAWSSVWSSVITLCQTVVFGDSWGASSIEIIEREPWTLIFFAGMYATITLGVLNLIVAAIVDSGAQAREEAQEGKKRRQRNEEQKNKERQKNRLLEICKILDDDESGSLSFDELLIGFERNTEFRNAMKDYNIDRKDLDVLFRVFDEDGTGVLDYLDFFNMIDSAREQASQQVLTFVRFAVMDLRKQMEAGQEMLQREMDAVKEFVVDAENSLQERLCRVSGEAPPPKKSLGKGKGNTTNTNRNSGQLEKERPPAPAAGDKRTSTPKAKAAPTAGAGDSNSTSSAPKASKTDNNRSASPSPGPPRKSTLRLPGEEQEKQPPLQQLLKINKELLKGMKKLLDANEIEFSPTFVGRMISTGSDLVRQPVGPSLQSPSDLLDAPMPDGEMPQEPRASPAPGGGSTASASGTLARTSGTSSSWLPAIPAFGGTDQRRTPI